MISINSPLYKKWQVDGAQGALDRMCETGLPTTEELIKLRNALLLGDKKAIEECAPIEGKLRSAVFRLDCAQGLLKLAE